MRRVLVVLVVLVAACLAVAHATGSRAAAPPKGNGLPVQKVTPGTLNPQVTQANISSTICVRGWTSTIRPPASYTTSLKRAQLRGPYAFYGDQRTSDYEEDHLISLELGGHPTDRGNLWPEPWAGAWGAKKKDQLENELRRRVCAGQLRLGDAQAAIATNWIQAYQRYVRP